MVPKIEYRKERNREVCWGTVNIFLSLERVVPYNGLEYTLIIRWSKIFGSCKDKIKQILTFSLWILNALVKYFLTEHITMVSEYKIV